MNTTGLVYVKTLTCLFDFVGVSLFLKLTFC